MTQLRTTQIRIDNARVIDPANGLDETKSLFIREGKFSDSCDDSAIHIDAKGLVACPGFIDLYARLREPGSTRKGSIESESKAALKAGFTTVFCSPDTNPVIDSTATVELIKQKAMSAKGARIVPIAALTADLKGERLSEMATLYKAGCLLLSNADAPMKDTGVLLSALEYAASFNLPISVRAVDAAIAGNGCAHAGSVATRLGLPGVSVVAETVAIARLIELCSSTGCRLHFARLSSARSVELITNAKKQGLPISCDVGIHHLYFTHDQIASFDTNFNSAVPFRTKEDRAALREAVSNGTVDSICSDHAPHDQDAKLAPFSSSESGLSAFDVFTPLLLGLPELLNIPLNEVIAKVTTGPAQLVSTENVEATSNEANTSTLFNSGAYSLDSGQRADLILIETEAAAELSPQNFISRGTNSPLAGLHSVAECTGENVVLKGTVQYSIIDGEIRKKPA